MDVSTNYFNNTISSNLGTITLNIINILTTPIFIIILIIIILAYVLLVGNLGSSSDTFSTISAPSDSSPIMPLMFVLFILLLIINGFQYLFGIDVIANIKNLFTMNPEIDVAIDTSRINAIKEPVPEMILNKQVFNIPENEYVYEDAKALCKAYGSRLATYQEVEDAYNSGGEWCNYGWSEGQMALFPTQQKTFDELQKIEGHENDCGRPGVNGGYMANPMIRYGVNCYGYKPRMTPQEEDLMAMKQMYPKTEKDIAMENRVNYWKDKLNEILISPFNHNSWSRL
jgi:hypothetical protein